MRAFIALDVPEEIKERIEEAGRALKVDGLVPVKKDAMHITLQFLGEIGDDEAKSAEEAMKGLGFNPFAVSLRGLSYFSPKFIRVVFAKVEDGAEELSELYAKIGEGLEAKGIKFEKEEYVPHLTIARVKHVGDKGRLIEAIGKYAGFDFGSFTAASIALKESTLTSGGPVYRNLYELKF